MEDGSDCVQPSRDGRVIVSDVGHFNMCRVVDLTCSKQRGSPSVWLNPPPRIDQQRYPFPSAVHIFSTALFNDFFNETMVTMGPFRGSLK